MSGFIGDLKFETPQSFTTNGTGANSNVQLTSSILLVTPAANNDSIDGFIPAQSPDGLEAEIVNVSNSNTLLLVQNTNSTAGYRVIMPPALTTLTLPPGCGVLLIFSQGIGWRPRKPGSFS
jgi:hypothetical protein